MASNNDIKKTLALINNINQSGNLDLKVHSLAKIKANLTNNEANLKIFKQLFGFRHLCELLKNNANTKVVNLVLSILANSAMKPDVCREIIIEHHILGDVSSILYNIEHPSIHCRAIRLLANVARTVAYSKYVMRFPFLPRIVSVLTTTTSSDTIITCIRAIKHLWLWDQLSVANELISLHAIKHSLDRLTSLPASSPAAVLSHLLILQAMLRVNTKTFIGQMSYLHYEWMVDLLCCHSNHVDTMLIHILLILAVRPRTHFELAKTSLVDKIISLIWPMRPGSLSTSRHLITILSLLCKENLFRQKIIQSPHAVTALLSYLEMDSVEDALRDNCVGDDELDSSANVSMNDGDGTESAGVSTSAKPNKSSTALATNSIHYNILLCINAYQYDHAGLYKFICANLIPILMKRLSTQIDKYEYRHTSPVCDQSKYLSTKQSLNRSGNMSPLSPGNTSPKSSSLSPSYMSPNRSPPWSSGAATSSELGLEMGDHEDDDDDKSVYSPLIEFSDDEVLSNADENEDSNDVNDGQLKSFSSLTVDSQEERLDVHVIRIMLHISYIKLPFEQLSYKSTWSTLVDYLVKIQQDDCCRNVYKIILIICKRREFLRAFLKDNFILVVHRKLCRTKHGPHCMICSNVMVYGQGIINEISNETNSHYGFSEIMLQYHNLDIPPSSITPTTSSNAPPSNIPSRAPSTSSDIPSNTPNNIPLSNLMNSPSRNIHPTTPSNNPPNPTIPSNIPENKPSNLSSSNIPTLCSTSGNAPPSTSNGGLIHFMIPYLLKDHPSFNRILFGSDAILSRILSELDGPHQEEAVSCVEELLSPLGGCEEVKRHVLCRNKCVSASFEGDITFLLDDGSTVKANRDLLTTRSLYFETMLCGNFKECDQTSNIKLSNISASCLSHLLKLLAHYCTCALPKDDVTVFLELVVKSDEYLLHEINHKLIDILYAPYALVNASNVHLVYAWSLQYNEFVQVCLSNYENFFSKNEYPSMSHGGGKRLKLSGSGEKRDDARLCAGKEDNQRAAEEDNGMGAVKEDDLLALKGDEMEGISDDIVDRASKRIKTLDSYKLDTNIEPSGERVCQWLIGSEDTNKINDTSVQDPPKTNDKSLQDYSGRTVIQSGDSDKKSIGLLTSSSCDDNYDTRDLDTHEVAERNNKIINVETEQAGCSYQFDEEMANARTDPDKVNQSRGHHDEMRDESNRRANITNDTLDEKDIATPQSKINEINVNKLGCDNKEKVVIKDEPNVSESDTGQKKKVQKNESNVGTDNITPGLLNESDIDQIACDTKDQVYLRDDSTTEMEVLTSAYEQPCLVSDLINEINQNKELLRQHGVSGSYGINVQSSIDQGKDEIKNILLLKNETSFKLRKLPLAGKRKHRGGPGRHSLGNTASGAERRENLNVHLIKLMFNSASRSYSCRKSVDIVRNIIEMSRSGEDVEDNIFHQFRQDLYDLIFETLR